MRNILADLPHVFRQHILLRLWDSEKKSVLGRTASNWGICLLFFLVFYGFLAGFFATMLLIFLRVGVPDKVPARTGMHNVLQSKAGLSMYPTSNWKKLELKYSPLKPNKLVESIDKLLKPYRNYPSEGSPKVLPCNNNVPENLCKFDMEILGQCKDLSGYGFPDGQPCLFLKLNKVYGWMPDIIGDGSTENILVRCEGKNSSDPTSIGPIDYYPQVVLDGKNYGYFDNSYYPFIGQPGYLAPLVAIRLASPQRGVAISVECAIHNLGNWDKTPLQFEVMIE